MGTLRLRQKETAILKSTPGDTLFQTLLRNYIPPHSVVVFSDGQPVSLFHRIQSGTDYEVQILEGYNYNEIKDLYRPDTEQKAVHQFRQLHMAPSRLSIENYGFGPDDLVESVEQRLISVIDEHDLIQANESVLLAFSGGIDSSALLLALDAICDEILNFELVTVTVGDYWTNNNSQTRKEINEVGNVDKNVIPTERIADIYNLDRPVTDVINGINNRDDGDVLAVANSFNRRVFEWFSIQKGIDKVCVGDHSSDILAGILAGVFEGEERNLENVPRHVSGSTEYIYPLLYHTKRELFLYQYIRTGTIPVDNTFDPWKLNKPYRHFCYFLADLLQSYCPGFMYWLNHTMSYNKDMNMELTTCQNCGKKERILNQKEETYCATCQDLFSFGYIS